MGQYHLTRWQSLRRLSSSSSPASWGQPTRVIKRKNWTSSSNSTTTKIDESSSSSISAPQSPVVDQLDHSNLKLVRLNKFIQTLQDQARRTIEFRQRLATDRLRLSKLGSIQNTLKSSQPSHFRTHPTQISDLTLATLITATSHLGHHRSLTCPTNYPLIYGTRSDIAIIDLRQTLSYLRRACNVIRETVENDGMVLFSNGVPGTEKAIQQATERLGANGYCLGTRPNGKPSTWVRGTLTNANEVLKRPRQVAKQLRLSNPNVSSDPTGHSDDPHPQRRRPPSSEGLESLKFLPSLIVLFSPRDSKVLIREAALKQIPTIGVIDTDVDPRVVTYPIPANDDSIRSIELIVGVLSRAAQDGLKRRTRLLSSRFTGSQSFQNVQREL